MADTSKKRTHLGWMFFDFATQPFHSLLITFIFAPYFVGFVAPDAVQGQSMWGYTTGAVGLIIAVMAPILGAMADTTGRRRPYIMLFALFYVIGAAYLWTAVPGAASVLPILIAFGIGLIGVEFMTTFTNAILPDIATREDIGRLSGRGWAFGYIGGLIAIVIMLLLFADEGGKTMAGIAPLFGLDADAREGTRAVGPITALWFVVFIIPFFLWVPDAPQKPRVPGAVGRALSDLMSTIKNLPKERSLLNYLIGSMLYRDALNGIFIFGGIYAVGVLEWPIFYLGIFGILTHITGALGAWLGGQADHSYGPRPVISTSILLLIGVAVAVLLTTRTSVLGIGVDPASFLPDAVFFFCGGLMGAAGGSLQAASRTMLVHQADPNRMTEAFGLYALAGKATAFLAPISIAVVTDLTNSQRLGLLPVVVLFILGLIFLGFVRADPVKDAPLRKDNA